METVRYTYRSASRRARRRPRCSPSGAGAGSCGTRPSTSRRMAASRPSRKLSKLLTEARGQHRVAASGVAGRPAADAAHVRDRPGRLVQGEGSWPAEGQEGSRSTLPSLEYTTRGFRIKNGRLCLPGQGHASRSSGPAPCRPTRPVCGSTATTSATGTRRSWSSAMLSCRPTPAELAIGIDWGVKTTATTTDARFDLPHLGHRKRCAAERAKAATPNGTPTPTQGPPPSKGYLTRQAAIGPVEKKAARQNTHDARAMGDAGRRQPRTDRGRGLQTEVSRQDPGWPAKRGRRYRGLQTRTDLPGTRAGRKVVLVPPAYTTMTCSECGTRTKERLGLGLRSLPSATACGHTAYRDLTPRGRSSPRLSVTVPVLTTSDIRSPPYGTLDRVHSELGIPRIHPWEPLNQLSISNQTIDQRWSAVPTSPNCSTLAESAVDLACRVLSTQVGELPGELSRQPALCANGTGRQTYEGCGAQRRPVGRDIGAPRRLPDLARAASRPQRSDRLRATGAGRRT